MRSRSVGLIAALLASLVSAPALSAPARAVSVVSIPAGWAYTYGSGVTSKSVAITAPTSTKSASIEKKSTFIVNYNTVPTPYQPAIQAAVDVWSQYFTSSVPIHIDATYGRQASLGVLASSSPVKFFLGSTFPGGPDNDIWYPSAMANAMAKKDLDISNPEVTIRINSNITPLLYLGTDGNCPRGLYDLESIIIHELTHGLGFISNDDILFGFGSIQQATPFDAYAQLPDGSRLMDINSPSTELAQAFTDKLVWSGARGIAANNGVKPPLYTPAEYSSGSSISHLDDAAFPSGTPNAVMTHQIDPAEVFHDPGPLAVAMLQDMMSKPPAGIPVGIPTVPRNVQALVGDKSAVITFDPPTNFRTSQVTSYEIKVSPGTTTKIATTSPVTITGLKNGVAYSFSITAKNALGTSESANTNAVIPQSAWKSTILDATADAKHLVVGSYNKEPIIAYSDSKNGDLKLATFHAGLWSTKVVDGNALSGGKTPNDVSGNISMCVGTINGISTLNIFYADLTKKWLRWAGYDGRKWSYSIVDGNGSKNAYTEALRIRTSSDVSVSSACVVTPSGLQVFYRDESQGILLGAVKDGTKWRYELIDGDRQTDFRTMGDVGFHMQATAVGARAYLLYDSVLGVNTNTKEPIRGEIRLAYRDSAYPEDWKYSSLDSSGSGLAVAGFDVALSNNGKSQSASWLASTINPSVPDQIRWIDLSSAIAGLAPSTLATERFGAPSSPLALDATGTIFGCQGRLCAENLADQNISLISGGALTGNLDTSWITLNKVRYAVISKDNKLTLLKPV